MLHGSGAAATPLLQPELGAVSRAGSSLSPGPHQNAASLSQAREKKRAQKYTYIPMFLNNRGVRVGGKPPRFAGSFQDIISCSCVYFDVGIDVESLCVLR